MMQATEFSQYAEPAARLLLGEPNPTLSTPGKELRYGRRGSLSLDVEKATFYDHEQGEGWGLLDFIKNRTGEPNPLAWLEQQGIKAPANDDRSTIQRRIVACYDYCNEYGEIAYQVVRYEPKDFRQRQPDDTKPGGWNWSIKGVAPLPYRLPDLLANPTAPVFVVEGEKDCDTLAQLGLIATCNSGGAKKGGHGWPDEISHYFTGRRVVVLPDNDATGKAHAQSVAFKLTRNGAQVQLLNLPGLPEKGDVTDWLNRGGTVAQLLEMASTAPVWQGNQPAPEPVNDNGQIQTLDQMPTVHPYSWPHMSDKNQPLNTIPNLAHLLAHYRFTVRYDVIRKDIVIRFPGQTASQDNQRETALNEILSLCALNRMPKSEAAAYLLNLADANLLNPVMDWITSKPWDGRSRFADLLATVETRADFSRELFALMLRRWLVSAVAAAAKPTGFWSKGVLVFQGEQSLGKTAWFRALLPDTMRDLLKVDAHIDPDSKDSIISAVSHWLVELGELDGTMRKADIARLKGFISQDVDQFRRPYARTEAKYQRRTVFFASVNPEQFLADDTGNVRWWTVPVSKIDHEHSIDVQQLWAEAFSWFSAGERWWLDRDEEAQLNESNRNYEKANPIEELLLSKYDLNKPRLRRLTATEILIELGYERPTRVMLNEAGTCITKVFGECKKSNGRKVFDVPTLNYEPPY